MQLRERITLAKKDYRAKTAGPTWLNTSGSAVINNKKFTSSGKKIAFTSLSVGVDGRPFINTDIDFSEAFEKSGVVQLQAGDHKLTASFEGHDLIEPYTLAATPEARAFAQNVLRDHPEDRAIKLTAVFILEEESTSLNILLKDIAIEAIKIGSDDILYWE